MAADLRRSAEAKPQSFGAYPVASLGDARELRLNARKPPAQEIDSSTRPGRLKEARRRRLRGDHARPAREAGGGADAEARPGGVLAAGDAVGGGLWRNPDAPMKRPRAPRAAQPYGEGAARAAQGDRRRRRLGGDRAQGKAYLPEGHDLRLHQTGYRSKLTLHDFRAMFSAITNKGRKDLGLERDRIERQLAHVERDDVRGA